MQSIPVTRSLALWVVGYLLFANLAFAQQKNPVKTQTSPALAVQVEPSQVKFTVRRTVLSYRFTVKNEAGETVFDSGSVSDAELNWKLADTGGAALPSGLFLYELAIQENADSVTQTQRGHFIIERAADRVWVTTQEPQGLSVSGSQISVAREGDTLTGGARGEGKPTTGTAVEGKQTKDDKSDKAETSGKLSIDTGASGGTTGYISRWTSATVLQDSVIFQDGTGRVGIGTTTPGDTLEVAGSTNIGGSFVNGMNFVNTAGSGFRRSQFTMSVKDGTATKGLFGFFADSSTNPTTNQQFTIHDWVANQSRLVISPTGNVGLGNTNPQAKLDVNGGIRSLFSNSTGIVVETTGGTNSWARLNLNTPTQRWFMGTARDFNGNQFYLWDETFSQGRFTIQPNGGAITFPLGNVGIGTSSPGAKLDVVGGIRSVLNSSTGVVIETTGATNSWARLNLNTPAQRWFMGTSNNFNGNQFYLWDETFSQGRLTIQPNGGDITLPLGNVGIGTSAPTAKLHVAGTTKTGVLEITAGADLAEHFALTEPVNAGFVVAIDPRQTGKLTLARGAYNRRVAGIISGANNLSAGMILPDANGAQQSEPVALSGRVWVHCDATRASISPGDLLTTSTTPGHAMKVRDYARAQGAIIGKAMTSLKAGKGMVLVLVTLQ